MSLSIDVPQDLERDLSAAAAREGADTREFALRLLRAAVLPEPVRTGKDLVAFWEAEHLVGSRSDVTDSQQHARAIRDAAERQRRQDRSA